MRFCIAATLLLLSASCATARIVNLDTGQKTHIVYKPVETSPIEIAEAEFKSAIAQLVLDMKLNVMLEEPKQDVRRSLLASVGGIVDGTHDRAVPPSYERICQQQNDPTDCLNLLAGGLSLGPLERRMMALFFAFDTVWDGVEEALKNLVNPAALRAMVVSVVGTALVMLVAPEPITKLVAIALTASLIAYLGTGPVWNLGQGFLRLMDESKTARSFSELEIPGTVSEEYSGTMVRVLVIVALTALGGKNAMAVQGSKLPGATQAAMRAQIEGGFHLPAAWAGEVQSISVASAGVLNVTLAPTAVAAVALGPGSTPQGDPEGGIHHICTDKNEVSEASGGPWTPVFEKLFRRAGMELSDTANQVRIRGHRGPHPREYHEEVLRRLTLAMENCRGTTQCQAALVNELGGIARDLLTAGTKLRQLITKNPGA